VIKNLITSSSPSQHCDEVKRSRQTHFFNRIGYVCLHKYFETSCYTNEPRRHVSWSWFFRRLLFSFWTAIYKNSLDQVPGFFLNQDFSKSSYDCNASCGIIAIKTNFLYAKYSSVWKYWKTHCFEILKKLPLHLCLYYLMTSCLYRP